MLATETAMRRGELLSLRWKYLDLVKRVAHLPMTKNGEPRDVPLSSRATEILHSLPRSIDDRVFPITVESFKKCWQRALVRAKEKYLRDCDEIGRAPNSEFLFDIRFHDLRHEATTRLSDRIQNPLELARITGHKDLKMLLRYYNISAEELAKKLG
jgi:integrase